VARGLCLFIKRLFLFFLCVKVFLPCRRLFDGSSDVRTDEFVSMFLCLLLADDNCFLLRSVPVMLMFFLCACICKCKYNAAAGVFVEDGGHPKHPRKQIHACGPCAGILGGSRAARPRTPLARLCKSVCTCTRLCVYV
jgi:hypothetical protein